MAANNEKRQAIVPAGKNQNPNPCLLTLLLGAVLRRGGGHNLTSQDELLVSDNKTMVMLYGCIEPRRTLPLFVSSLLLLLGTTSAYEAERGVVTVSPGGETCQAEVPIPIEPTADDNHTNDKCSTTNDCQEEATAPVDQVAEIPVVGDGGTPEDSIDFGVEQRVEGLESEQTLDVIQRSINYMRNEVMVKPEYESLREHCKNEHQDCSFWASIGECEKNPGYMTTNCAPACQSCEMLDITNRCPLNPDAEDAMGPGDVNKMFERIINDEEFKKYGIKVHSRPSRPSASSEEENTADYQIGPWLITFDNFVSPEEADRLIELGSQEGYKRSTDVGNRKFDGTYDEHKSKQRTSENSWCLSTCYEDPVSQAVAERIVDVTGVPETNSENLQMLRYQVGQFYGVHHDYIEHGRERQSGVRILTLYIYLNDVEEGGGTNFPQLDLTVTPKKGSAVLWPSVLDSDPNEKDRRTEHQALPVIKGVKYGANAWIHMRDYKGPNKIGCA